MTVGVKAARQYQGIFEEVIPFVATVNLGNAVDAATVSADITVTGAALGDLVRVAIGVDVADLTVDAHVTAANTVTVTVNNNTGTAVNLAETTFKGIVEKTTGQIWVGLGG